MYNLVKRALIQISGKVQGVFFRAFAKQNANKLSIVGYVKNLRNGSIEIIAQGDELKIKKFLDLMRAGPMMAKVEDFKVSYEDIDPDCEFFDMR